MPDCDTLCTYVSAGIDTVTTELMGVSDGDSDEGVDDRPGRNVVKCSGAEIWPIQLQVNEVPTAERLVLAALWFWKKKPAMVLFQGHL